MNQTLVNIFRFLEQIGLVDVLLPLILVFVIVYGIFDRTKVLGPDKRNANAVVALVMAFLVVAVVNYVNIINSIVRFFGLLVIMVLAFALIYGLFGKDIHIIKKRDSSPGSGGGSGGAGGSGSGQAAKDKAPGASKPGELEKIGEYDPSKPGWHQK